MEYTFVSFTQGTGPDDPSIVAVIVKYQDREICYTTYIAIDWTIVQDSAEYNAAVDPVVADVQGACSPTIDNPMYDPSLTACWNP